MRWRVSPAVRAVLAGGRDQPVHGAGRLGDADRSGRGVHRSGPGRSGRSAPRRGPASRSPVAHRRRRDGHTERPDDRRNAAYCDEPTDSRRRTRGTRPTAAETPLWLKVLASIFLLAVLGAILALVVYLLLAGARAGGAGPAGSAREVEFTALDEPARLAEAIASDAAEQDGAAARRRPAQRHRRRWHAVRGAGRARRACGRRPWETSSEYAIRILDLVSADSGAVNRLAGALPRGPVLRPPDHRGRTGTRRSTRWPAIRRSLGAAHMRWGTLCHDLARGVSSRVSSSAAAGSSWPSSSASSPQPGAVRRDDGHRPHAVVARHRHVDAAPRAVGAPAAAQRRPGRRGHLRPAHPVQPRAGQRALRLPCGDRLVGSRPGPRPRPRRGPSTASSTPCDGCRPPRSTAS